MSQRFEILRIFDHHNRGQFIFARQLDFEKPIEVKEGALFGGIPVYHYSEMPKSLDENNNLRMDIYVFRPILNRFPKEYFKEGQVVELVMD